MPTVTFPWTLTFETAPPVMIAPKSPLSPLSGNVLRLVKLFGSRTLPSSPSEGSLLESESRPSAVRLPTMEPKKYSLGETYSPTFPRISMAVFGPKEIPVTAPLLYQTIAWPEVTFTSVASFPAMEVSPVSGLPAPPSRLAPLTNRAGAMRDSRGSMRAK